MALPSPRQDEKRIIVIEKRVKSDPTPKKWFFAADP